MQNVPPDREAVLFSQQTERFVLFLTVQIKSQRLNYDFLLIEREVKSVFKVLPFFFYKDEQSLLWLNLGGLISGVYIRDVKKYAIKIVVL